MKQKYYKLESSVYSDHQQITHKVWMEESDSGQWVKREDFERMLELAQSHEYTSDRVASIAGKILQDPESSDEMKSIAASVLTQAKDKS